MVIVTLGLIIGVIIGVIVGVIVDVTVGVADAVIVGPVVVIVPVVPVFRGLVLVARMRMVVLPMVLVPMVLVRAGMLVAVTVTMTFFVGVIMPMPMRMAGSVVLGVQHGVEPSDRGLVRQRERAGREAQRFRRGLDVRRCYAVAEQRHRFDRVGLEQTTREKIGRRHGTVSTAGVRGLDPRV